MLQRGATSITMLSPHVLVYCEVGLHCWDVGRSLRTDSYGLVLLGGMLVAVGGRAKDRMYVKDLAA